MATVRLPSPAWIPRLLDLPLIWKELVDKFDLSRAMES